MIKRNTQIILLSILLMACNKNEVVLQGTILEECGGAPAAGIEVSLFRNFQEGNWLTGDTPEALFETTKTDENGNFSFSGRNWSSKTVTAVWDGSIRVNDKYGNDKRIAIGNLGKGKHAEDENGEHYNNMVGTLYVNGVTYNPIFKAAYKNPDGIPYDSIRLTVTSYDLYYNETISSNDGVHFIDTGSCQSISKYFFDPTNELHEKYENKLFYRYYRNGTEYGPYSKFFQVDGCESAYPIIEF